MTPLPLPIRTLAALLVASSLGACTLGPDYQRPQTPVVAEFKQAEGWKPATPHALDSGQWWLLYDDPVLTGLIERLNLDNQNLAAAEARYRQARALVRGARSELFPAVGASAGVTRSAQGSRATSVSTGSSVSENYELGINASWELDLWGRLRRTLEANRANALASEADLAAVRLSLQAELAQTYMQLRVLDEQRRLFAATIDAYERSLGLTRNQYRAGIAPKSDVTQAVAQLRSAQAQAVDLLWQRAQLEHAIAVLVGVPPSELDIAVREDVPELPDVPRIMASELLERRPDIATAEQDVIAANALIGATQAAWYPDLTLSASGGYSNSAVADLISVPNRFWSLGPSMALTLLDFGGRRAELERVEASYDETVATYRQTVLDAFREVEDYLVQLRVLGEEAQIQQEALQAAQDSLRLIQNQYQAGIVDFLSVATLQTNALNTERTNLALLGDRLVTSVQLIAALGGGWQVANLADGAPVADEQPQAGAEAGR